MLSLALLKNSPWQQTNLQTPAQKISRCTVWHQSVTRITNLWQLVTDNGIGYPISSSPSMHVAWGVILLWFLFKLRKIYGLLLSPLILAETVGAVLLLQHFVIDILTGATVAFIAIFLTNKLTALKENRMKVNPKSWYGSFVLIDRGLNTPGTSLVKYLRQTGD